MLKTIPPERIAECLDDASRSPLADPTTAYPAWYLHRWHFLPEGYLSRRSVTAYDAVIRRIYNLASENALHAALVGELRRSQPARVLELGCGPGNALAAMRRALPQAELTGIDLSPFALETARDRLPGGGAALVHGDATHLRWADGSFDAVVSQHVLGHLPRAAAVAAWREARRVLRPGGSLYLLEHAWHRRLPGDLQRALRRRLLGGVILLERFEKRAA
ncbi:MAG: class I SAM-dependent methyltransferase [Tepidiformaceae bacterium]